MANDYKILQHKEYVDLPKHRMLHNLHLLASLDQYCNLSDSPWHPLQPLVDIVQS